MNAVGNNAAEKENQRNGRKRKGFRNQSGCVSGSSGADRAGAGSGPGQAQAPAAAKKKKGSKGWIIWLIALLGVAGYCAYTYFFAYKPTFKVDNYEFTFKTSVKELRDNGIVLCDSYGKESDNNGSVSRKTIYNISYNLGVKKGGVVKKTGFVVQIANFRSSSCKINDCTIYKIYYYPEYQSADVSVLIGGQDFSTAKIDSSLKSKIKDAKIPFKDSEIDSFTSGKSNTLIDSNSSYKFEFSKQTGSGNLLIEFWRNVNVNVTTK